MFFVNIKDMNCCNSPYRLRYWNEIKAEEVSAEDLVATVLTVYGIETASLRRTASIFSSLQQSLPFTVLKLNFNVISLRSNSNRCNSPYRLRYWNGLETVQAYMSMSVLQQSLPFTVLKHFIATLHAVGKFNALQQSLPFTVLKLLPNNKDNSGTTLQQSLPFTVLKPFWFLTVFAYSLKLLQQSLPFTVLKLALSNCCNAPRSSSCNSPYRLRYWNLASSIYSLYLFFKLQQSLPFTVLKHIFNKFIDVTSNAL